MAGKKTLSMYEAMQKSLGELETERNILAVQNEFLLSAVNEAIEAGQISHSVLLIGPHRRTGEQHQPGKP